MQKVDAAIKGDNNKAYFFEGDKYLKIDVGTMQVEAGYPLAIADNWPGLWADDLDAATNWGDSGEVYFFKGSEYIGYNLQQDTADEAKPIEGNWSGVWDSDIDAVVDWGNGKLYFFKGSEYIRYDINTDRADDGYPQPIEGNWSGVWPAGVDAAINWGNGKAYLFRGDEYISYDVAADAADSGYPKKIAGGWPPSQAGSQAAGQGSNTFSFSLRSGEGVRARIVRCCAEALAGGQMGKKDRHDFYREFISCRQEKTPQAAEALTGVRTSCAMFVRAVRHWCGATPMGPYKPGTGMFVSLGNVSFGHPAFVPHDGTHSPKPGDQFYIASTRQSNDGHTGIFIEQLGPNEWRTAEGGGGGPPDGTLCRFTSRKISGKTFSNDGRTLWGWFDCTKVGLPE
jgi:hypothetical protein